ncbi:MAG TPA: glycosyltransferase N-terminal domain-containing protein, partial [bacterium]|nr:glycosyltransferase N-terminal domain-containing protein [bacterium]
ARRLCADQNVVGFMYALYNVLGFLYLLIAGPAYLLKVYRNRDYRQGFGSRFGFFADDLAKRLAGHRWIWVHAVSVGEVIAARPVLGEIRKRFPNDKILLSTVTPTGQQMARESKDADMTVFLPVDVAWWAVNRLVAMVNPKVLVIMETELWPNLIRSVSKRGVPIAMINGRISDRSFKRYHKARIFLRDLLSRISFFGMQTEDDARRIMTIGAPKERVHVSGSCKFDTLNIANTENLETLRALIVAGRDRRVIIAGSTHPGEEEMLLRVYEKTRREVENPLLVIAPRHIDRSPAIKTLVEQTG